MTASGLGSDSTWPGWATGTRRWTPSWVGDGSHRRSAECRQELAGKVAEEHHAWRRGRRPFEATGDRGQPVKEGTGAVQWGLGDVEGCPNEWPAGAEVLQCSRRGGGGREVQHRPAGQHRGRRRGERGHVVVAQRIATHTTATVAEVIAARPLPDSPPACRQFRFNHSGAYPSLGRHVTSTADWD